MTEPVSSTFDLASYLRQCQQRVTAHLQTQLQALPESPQRLREAMSYATLLGGKRLRPALTYAAADAVGANRAQADAAACAVEMIHCYSLIHDDLPAMDNDDLRRGRPTVHRAFDEASAILAGDALQTLAFEVLSEATSETLGASTVLEMVQTLARAAGFQGMAGGQALDTAATNQQLDLQALQHMHQRKTGALIEAAVMLGGLCGGGLQSAERNALQRYASHIGLAFQVQDDILDVVGETAVLGKAQGADQALNKPTYVSLLGLAGAQQKADELLAQAHSALQVFGPRAGPLLAIADFIVRRQH